MQSLPGDSSSKLKTSGFSRQIFIKKITRYNFSYLEVMLGKCFDKNLAVQIKDFFLEVQQHNIRNVLLIFNQVEAIDSTGIGLLVNFQEELGQQGFCLKFVGVSTKILHLFEILGLGNFFPIYPTLAEALASFFSPQDQTFFTNPDWENEVVQVLDTTKNEVVQSSDKRTNEENTPISSHSISPEETGTPLEILTQKQGHLLVPEDNSTKISTSEELAIEEEEEDTAPPRRMHTIKIKKRDSKVDESPRTPYLLKVEYSSHMLCGQEFPLRVFLNGPAKKKEKTWEIIPKIAGCVVTPPRVNIHDAELPMEFVFSIIPLAHNRSSSEILIFGKRSPLRQFSLRITCVSCLIPITLNILSASVLLLTFLFYSWGMAQTDTFVFWFQGILWSSILALGAVVYSYLLRPRKNSNQFSFYEKGEESNGEK